MASIELQINFILIKGCQDAVKYFSKKIRKNVSYCVSYHHKSVLYICMHADTQSAQLKYKQIERGGHTKAIKFYFKT